MKTHLNQYIKSFNNKVCYLFIVRLNSLIEYTQGII